MVPYAPTMNIDTSFKAATVTMTGNVSSYTLGNGFEGAQVFHLSVCQGVGAPAGGYQVLSQPSNVVGVTGPLNAAGCTYFRMVWDVASQAWISSIIGQAVVGPAGPQGPQGVQGVQGPIGPVGGNGTNGAPGSVGPTGPTGPQGQTGPTGLPGATGAQGLTGPQGPAGPTGSQGLPGSSGATGAVGGTGAIGPTGSQGVAGAQGIPGATGGLGPVGPTGGTGATGPSGNVGATGAQGVAGPTGAAGAQGAAGATGAQGTQGIPGALFYSPTLLSNVKCYAGTVATTAATGAWTVDYSALGMTTLYTIQLQPKSTGAVASATNIPSLTSATATGASGYVLVGTNIAALGAAPLIPQATSTTVYIFACGT